jgi:hypothetical protein
VTRTELRRLLDLLLKLSETTEYHEGMLRDQIAFVRESVYRRLGE